MTIPYDLSSAAQRLAGLARAHGERDGHPHMRDLVALLPILDAVAAGLGDEGRVERWARMIAPKCNAWEAWVDEARAAIALANAEKEALAGKVQTYLAAVDHHRSEDDQWGPGRAYQPVRDARKAMDDARVALDAAVRRLAGVA